MALLYEYHKLSESSENAQNTSVLKGLNLSCMGEGPTPSLMQSTNNPAPADTPIFKISFLPERF